MAPLRPLVLFNGVPEPSELCARLRLLDIDAYHLQPEASADSGSPETLLDINGDFATLYNPGATFYV